MRRLTTAILAMAAASLLCGGCAPKFTRQGYETIRPNAPVAEVEYVIGRPTEKSGNTWTYIHESPFYKAVLVIEDGQVKSKAWYDDKFAASQPSTMPTKAEQGPAGMSGRKRQRL